MPFGQQIEHIFDDRSSHQEKSEHSDRTHARYKGASQNIPMNKAQEI